MPTDPSVCFGLSVYGFGPFDFEGTTTGAGNDLDSWAATSEARVWALPFLIANGAVPPGTPASSLTVDQVKIALAQEGFPLLVVGCPTPPTGSGYGGVGYGYNSADPTTSLEQSDAGYGLGSFGATAFPAPLFPVDGGYGGDPYGTGGYGSIDVDPPRPSSATSLNGYQIELFFSEEMLDNADLTDPTNYTITSVVGAPSTVVSVTTGVAGEDGYTSVIITHSGTTLGGTYQVEALNLLDLSGNPILSAPVALLTRGDAPSYVVVPTGGRTLEVTFSEEMLAVGDYPGGAVETIESPDSYAFDSSPSYPISLEVQAANHPLAGDLTKVELDVLGMTSLDYSTTISPASAIEYLGDVLPDASTSFTGVEVGAGVGASSTVAGGSLYLTSPASALSLYGWAFLDTSGKLVSGSTFRADFSFDASGSFTPVPAITEIAWFQVYDGAVEWTARLLYNGVTATAYLRLISGAGFSQDVEIDWTSGPHTISLIRNRKAAIATVLFDGTPLYSTAEANLAAPVIIPAAPGLQALLDSTALTSPLTNFGVSEVTITASSTVYSGSWNFLHAVTGSFTGIALTANDTFKVAKGPLTKGWGDGTPATKEDVTVYVAGVPVDVAEVNPYTGEITTTIPVPLMPLGTADVVVDYFWLASPPMAFDGLNTKGLVLNKYDMTSGHHLPVGRGTDALIGAVSLTRFPMGVVLGPLGRSAPYRVSKRHLGFDLEYSAILNSPGTLLLNQHPNRTQQEGFSYSPAGYSVAYEGLVRPTSDGWSSSGTDQGGINAGAGTYTIVDGSSGSYDPDDPQAVFYYRDADLSFPASANVVGRFIVEDGDYQTDGVFTGIGFGVHDGHHLYMVGLLDIGGVKHAGFLTDPKDPASASSWDIGSEATLTLTSQTEASVSTALAPGTLAEGDRFQILEGPQAGVYTCTGVVAQTDGTTTLTVSPAFPAPFNLWGNNDPVANFELDWSSGPTTYRLTVAFESKIALFEISGGVAAVVGSLDGEAIQLPNPADTSLLLPSPTNPQEGQVFFGSLSREATNTSTWSFFRYGVVPDVTTLLGAEVSVAAEMAVLPEAEEDGWDKIGDFGDVTPSGTLLLKKTSEDVSRNLLLGYARNEPFFASDAKINVTARFRVETGTGIRDVSLKVEDTLREVHLGTLLYQEGFSGHVYRRLVRVPGRSFNGLQLPEKQTGWAKTSGSTLANYDIREATLEVTQTDTERGGWLGSLNSADSLNFIDTGGRVFDARLAVLSYTSNGTSDTGIWLGGDFGTSTLRHVHIHLRAGGTPGIRVVTGGYGVVQEYNFDWTDGAEHSYRVIADEEAGVLQVIADDTLLVPTLATALFSGGSDSDLCIAGQLGLNGAGVLDTTLRSVVAWRSFSIQAIPPVAAKRTLGILVGPDPDDINDWEIPRTDTTTYLNSSATGPVVEEMDWRSYVEVRLWRDPTWGVTLYRPDLAVPPYYTGAPGPNLDTTEEPSAGWINVEYRQIPQAPLTFGRISWGALFNGGLSQQRWDYLRYRFFRFDTDERATSEHNVLNYYSVVNSGERTTDTGLETAVVETVKVDALSLLPSHVYASYVYKVIDGSAVYTREMWTFNSDTQLLTLIPDEDGNPRTFSGRGVEVTVIYTPGVTTNTYLLNQPLTSGVTVLNEGTPSYTETQVEEGGVFGDIELLEVSEGKTGLLSTFCEATFLTEALDGYATDEGEIVYEAGGAGAPLGGVGDCAGLTETTDRVGLPVGGQVFIFDGPAFSESMGLFSAELGAGGGGGPYLFASGGNYVGVDPTTSTYFALGGTLNSTPLYAVGEVASGVSWALTYSSSSNPLEETGVLGASDVVAPTEPPDWPTNPDDAPVVTGAALSIFRFTVASPGPPGPWGGPLFGVEAWNPEYGLFGLAAPVPGVLLELWDTIGGLIATFTAVAGAPAAPGDWSVVGDPALNLEIAINTHPVAGPLVLAEAGLDDAVPTVTVKATVPLILPDFYFLTTSAPAAVYLGIVQRLG